MNRAAQMQPPIDRGIELRVEHRCDPRRLRRVAEILADILDNAKPLESGSAPEEGSRP